MGAANIRQAIATALMTSGVTAIVGTRCYPMLGMPLDPVRPYIAWRRSGGTQAAGLLSGGTAGRAKRGQAGVAVECHTNTVAELDALTDAVMAAARAHTPDSTIRVFEVVGGPTDLAVTNEGSNQYIPAARIDISVTVNE